VSPRDRYLLTLDGVLCGAVIAAEGGDISAPVLRKPEGAFVHKTLGTPAPEPIDLAFDLSLDRVLYQWVADFWQGKASPKSGSLTQLDFNNQARSELTFDKAEIVSTTVPAMDAASKAQAQLSVRLVPAGTSRQPASGPVAGLPPKPKKPWLRSSFRLQVDGLDATRVSKIDALIVTSRDDGVIDPSDLRALLAETTVESWADWHEQFVVEGKSDPTNEKSATLDFLAADLKTTLASVKLSGLGIHRLTRQQTGEAATEQIPRLLAELYCQRMELVL
jgi:hypothetical protein